MTFEDDLKDSMNRTAASDGPAPSAMVATFQAAMIRRQRRTRLSMVFGVAAAVAAIAVGTAAFGHSPSQSEVPVAAAPPATPASVARIAETTTKVLTTTSTVATVGTTMNAVATTVNPALVGTSSARCYASADVARSDNYISITIGGDGSHPVAAGPLALTLCTNSWRQGDLSTNLPYKIDRPTNNPSRSIPELVACVLPAKNSDEGVQEVAILPGSANTCTILGLPVFPG